MEISREWSGELITREEGSISNPNDWKIYCEEIFLADIGSGAYTSYQVDTGGFKAPDIVSMYDQFPGLVTGELKNHHIHTHHNMGAFFSGTDWEQLEERAQLSNYFMMLVVDCKGTYQAKVASIMNIDISSGVLSFVNDPEKEIAPISLARIPSNRVMMVMNCKIEWEDSDVMVDDSFKLRYDSVKNATRYSQAGTTAYARNNSSYYGNKSWGKQKEIDYGYDNDWTNGGNEWTEMDSTKSAYETKELEYTKTDVYSVLTSAYQNKKVTEGLDTCIFNIKAKFFKFAIDREQFAKEFVTRVENQYHARFKGKDDANFSEFVDEVLSVLSSHKTNLCIKMIYENLIERQIEIETSISSYTQGGVV